MAYHGLKIFVSLSVFLVVRVIAAEPLRVVGSDLLGVALIEALVQEAERREWDLSLDFTGSLQARVALEAGEADLAVLALPPGRSVPEGMRSFPLGFEVVAVVVHGSNPVQDITMPQLASLFSQGADESFRWGRVGATGNWADRQITFHAVRDRNSLGLEIFKASVLGPRDISGSVSYWPTTREMARHLVANPGAIGLLSATAELPAGVRTLLISKEADAPAFRPVPQAVLYGDYGLSLPYVIVVRQADNATAQEVTGFLLSDAIAEVLQNANYMPLPASERRQFQLEVELGR